jgi:DNA polymerase III sliding clamp (beta) subunit (PCNA family)
MIECSFFKDDKNYIITMDFDDNKMTLLNKNNEMGEFKETYEIEHNGNNLSVSVNGEYLKQALSTFESDYVNLYFEDTPLKPFVIVGCEDVDRTLIQLMLPVRTY